MIFLCLAELCQAQGTLSNRLPLPVLRDLQEQLGFDPDRLPPAEAEDFRNFWALISAPAEPAEGIVDSVFGTSNTADGASGRFPSLYSAKFVVLRQLLRDPNERVRNRAQNIFSAWRSRYLASASAIINLAGVAEYSEILQNFRRKMEPAQRRGAGGPAIQIVDLSPDERARWAQQAGVHLHRGEDIQARDREGRFLVQGRFQEDRGYFAIDFARPISETLITFAHEIVHAGDPNLEIHNRTFVELRPQVLAILQRVLGPEASQSINASSLVGHVLDEVGVHSFLAAAGRIREERMQQIRGRPNPSDGSSPSFSDQDLAILRRWLRSVIGLTVENELRAYGFSLLVYEQLRSRIQILPPSENRGRLVQQFVAGDGVVAENLGMRLSPFAPGSTLNRTLLGLNQQASGQLSVASPFQRARLAIETLELTYLEEMGNFIRTLGTRFAQSMGQGGPRAGEANPRPSRGSAPRNSLLPVWALPQGFESPANPYQVLSARITSSWVLRFRQVVDVIVADLGRLNSPLFSLRAGILDLHDMSVAEREVLGVNFIDSPYAADCEVSGAGIQSSTPLPREVRELFRTVSWNPSVSITGDFIDGVEVARNLVRLRSLRSSAWLDNAFPHAQTTFLGIRVFLHKLRSGDYDRNDLDPTRAQELIRELEGILASGGNLQTQKNILRLLLEQLGAIYQVAEEQRWSPVMQNFQRKAAFVQSALEALGSLDGSSERNARSLIQARLDAFRQQIEPVRRDCANSANMRFYAANGPFTFGYETFPLSVICNGGHTYLVRQPHDFSRHMTTQVRDNFPHSRICTGSRWVRLFPYQAR